jgi:hypothetical protein
MEEKEIIKVGFSALKGVNPEIALKLEEAQAAVNTKIQNEILPQVNEWQKQADAKYETLLKKEPIKSS